jgi:hypothetical protein
MINLQRLTIDDDCYDTEMAVTCPQVKSVTIKFTNYESWLPGGIVPLFPPDLEELQFYDARGVQTCLQLSQLSQYTRLNKLVLAGHLSYHAKKVDVPPSLTCLQLTDYYPEIEVNVEHLLELITDTRTLTNNFISVQFPKLERFTMLGGWETWKFLLFPQMPSLKSMTIVNPHSMILIESSGLVELHLQFSKMTSCEISLRFLPNLQKMTIVHGCVTLYFLSILSSLTSLHLYSTLVYNVCNRDWLTYLPALRQIELDNSFIFALKGLDQRLHCNVSSIMGAPYPPTMTLQHMPKLTHEEPRDLSWMRTKVRLQSDDENDLIYYCKEQYPEL